MINKILLSSTAFAHPGPFHIHEEMSFSQKLAHALFYGDSGIVIAVFCSAIVVAFLLKRFFYKA